MSFRTWRSMSANCTRICVNYFKTNNASNRTLNLTSYNLFSRVSLKCSYSTANTDAVRTYLPNEPIRNEDTDLGCAEDLKDITVQTGLNSNELEDVSDYAPATTLSFNFASFVNKSPTLQEFVKLNVNLYTLEKRKSVAEFILKLDFEKDVKQYLTFLHDNGVSADQLGQFITNYPLIFKEDLDNLQIRINYMQSKRFTADMIARIITKNPNWLSFSTQQIDSKLGHFQREFKLQGNEVRYLAVKQPRLITFDIGHIKTNTFSFKEEMGFSVPEMKKILLDKPRLFKSGRSHLVERFNYVHNIMKIKHDLIAMQPVVLTSRLFRIKQRHLFLQSLGRAQYDPKEPRYVSLTALVTGTDSDFCRDVAKTSTMTFNMFQKTS